jgi:hypothetical protein
VSRSRWLLELARFGVTRQGQLLAKSDQWWTEVDWLIRKRRWAAGVYLGGFVVELLLKAELWPRRAEPRITALLGRSHDLRLLLAHCPRLEEELQRLGGERVRASFDFLGSWSVRIRYNPKQPSADDARDFWRRLAEVREWLRGKF